MSLTDHFPELENVLTRSFHFLCVCPPNPAEVANTGVCMLTVLKLCALNSLLILPGNTVCHIKHVFFSAEVIRTRLREEGTKYKSFVQTARLVFREEGYLAFYRGLFAQLIRQIPNTAIVLSTYELIVYLLEDHPQ